jgi:hypothetical protein
VRTSGEPGPDTLLLETQRRLESLYELESGPPVTDFLISEEEAAPLPGGGSRTLVTHDGDEVSLGVVLESSVRTCLAKSDPRVQLDASNLGPFCILIEEVSHFVYLLFCARVARTVTELELELQGEVDKFLTAAVLLSRQNQGPVSGRLRERLFRGYTLVAGLTPEREERYRTASALAYRYCGHLEGFLRPDGLRGLARESRRFYRLGQREKLERIRNLG